MADDLLLTLVGALMGCLLTVATLAGAHIFRRVHELRDRILAVEAALVILKPIQEFIVEHGSKNIMGGRLRVK